MHGVCDYIVIHKGKLETGPNDTLLQPVAFTLASNAVLTVHSLLAFTVHVFGSEIELTVSINQQTVADHHLSDGFIGSFVKVIDPGVLQHGTNHLRFGLTTQNAVSVYAEDIALWWFKDSLA